MGKKVCVLEDDDGIREVIEFLLSDAHYEVKGFATVSDFMANSKNFIPDLFLLDVMLPDGNGMEVCCLLKASTVTKHIPIVMMSAHAGVKDIDSGCKAQDFISKPFDIDDLLNRVNMQLTA